MRKSINEIGEIWRPIKDFELRYSVSTYGRIMSIFRNVNHYGDGSSRIVYQRILKHGLSAGYPFVSLWKGNKGHSFRIHSLMMDTFPEFIKGNGPISNHIDGNKENNHISNLERTTYRGNLIHAYKNGLNKKQRKVVCLETGEVFLSISSAAKKFKAWPNHVWMVCNGRQETCRGYKFRYQKKGINHNGKS